MTLVDTSRGGLSPADIAAVQRMGGSPIARHAWNLGPGSTLPEQTD